MICAHSGESAPPPTNAIGSSRCRQKRSTTRCIQRALSATPSSTARATSARVVASVRLCSPPRTSSSSTGVRSPLSHGVKTTPPLPGRALAASRSSSAKPSRPVPGSSTSRRRSNATPAVCCSVETR
jgi:hypothetical protein